MLCADCREPAAAGRCARCGSPALLAGRFRLLRALDRGNDRSTLAWEDTRTGRPVTVEEVVLLDAETEELERLDREASTLRSLAHPGIPAFVEHSRDERRAYLVTESTEGETLAEEAERRRYTERDVADVLGEVLAILAYLHDLRPPLVHRDVCPRNLVRRREDGRLLLVGFGAATEATGHRGRSGRGALGDAGHVGRYGYSAPEVMSGEAVPASDLYGLGATAWALLTRRDPAELVGSGPALRDEVFASEPMKGLLLDLLQPDVTLRARDAREVAARLAAIAGEPGAASRLLPVPAARHEPGASTYSDPPPVPRAIPPRFLLRYGPVAYIKRVFGAVFGCIGAAVGAGQVVAGLATGSLLHTWLGGAIGAFFAVAGAGVWLWGSRERATMHRLWQTGRVAPGSVAWTRTKTSLRIARRHPIEIEYSFQAYGRTVKATALTMDERASALPRGSAVAVIFDPDEPDRSIPYLG